MSKCCFAVAWMVAAIARFAHRRWWMNALAAMGFLVALSAPLHAAPNSLIGGSYTSVSQGVLYMPQATSAGTVLARNYLTPQALCGAAQCSVASFWQCGFVTSASTCATSGPTCNPTQDPGVCIQVVINGQVTAGFAWPGAPVTINQPVEFQFVSTGAAIAGNTIGYGSTPPFNRATIYWFTDASAAGSQPSAANGFQIYMKDFLTPVAGTCTAPSQTITLPPVMSIVFGGAGSTAGAQSFNLSLNNCPAGYSRIGYSLIPVGAAVCPTTPVPMPCAITSTSANGVLPLSASSTASGVGIQVTDTSGSPVPFRYSIAAAPLGSVKPAASYTVPLVAKYIQTGSAITPGSVNAQMQVLLDYQ
ncbi:fimbrial protein [Dyella sp. RRB7]|uniref:fimbrial protein n=1 Tax=Dyella sp. RRB7 TaxID=2919502 RepID=UPI001FAAD5A8|nr:fimbrial protein [Dyella sp. RRB7]